MLLPLGAVGCLGPWELGNVCSAWDDVPGEGLLPIQLSQEVQPGPFAPDMALCPLSARLEQQGEHRQVGIVTLESGIPVAQGLHGPLSFMSCPGADKLSFHSGSSFPEHPAPSISPTLVLDLAKTALSHSSDFGCDWALLLHPALGVGVLSLRRGALHVPLSQGEEQCPRRCSWALLLVDLRHNLSLSVPLFICRLKMTLSSQGCPS